MRPLLRLGVMCLALFVSASMLRANVAEQAPQNTILMVKVKDLAGVSKKIGELANQWQVAAFAPPLADPLAFVLDMTGLAEGINTAGDMAIFFAAAGDDDDFDPERSMFILVPVSDFQKFVGNLQETQEQDGITRGRTRSGARMFVAKRGAYAAIAPRPDLLKAPVAALKFSPVAAKAVNGSDVTLWANLPELRKSLLPMLKEGREEIIKEATDEITQQGQEKFVPLIKAAIGQGLNAVERFLTDSEAGVVALNLVGGENGGIQLGVFSEFTPDSYLGKLALNSGSTDAALLNGLPDGKYIAYGGFNSDPKLALQLLEDVGGPIIKEVAAIEGLKGLAEIIDTAKAEMAATRGVSNYGVLAQVGQLGQDPLIQMVAVQRGDAAKIRAAQNKQIEQMNALLPQIDPNMAKLASKFTANAKTIDGVAFDEVVALKIENPETPELQQMAQMYGMLFGAAGMVQHIGVIDEGKVLYLSGFGDEAMKAAIAAAKADSDALSRNAAIQLVDAQLPKRRAMVIYIALDQVAATGLKIGGMFMPNIPQVQLPPGLPPVGITLGNDASAVRVDVFIPSKTVQALIAAGLQAFMQMQGGPGGGL